jgi:hypothetical protein
MSAERHQCPKTNPNKISVGITARTPSISPRTGGENHHCLLAPVFNRSSNLKHYENQEHWAEDLNQIEGRTRGDDNKSSNGQSVPAISMGNKHHASAKRGNDGKGKQPGGAAASNPTDSAELPNGHCPTGENRNCDHNHFNNVED